jgi:biopolymer transport protein ExbB
MIHTDPISFMLAAADPASGESLLDIVQKGGLIGYIIIGLSVGALVLIVLHLVQIRRSALLPPEQLEETERLLARGDVNNALAYTADPANDSYFSRIMTVGLTRYTKSAFGAFEVKSAIEEAGEEQTARLYRSTDALGVIGSIAPLLGLLGTVVGMVGAFSTLSKAGAAKPELLASDISLALITTVQGLIVAIPCVALFTYFRNRIDAFASEAAQEIERIILHLESAAPAPGAAVPVAGTGGGALRPVGAATLGAPGGTVGAGPPRPVARPGAPAAPSAPGAPPR